MSEAKDRTKRRRPLRRILIGLAVVVGLVVVGAVAAVALIPADKIKDLAFEQLETQTGLRGSATDASVSLFPLGARLEGLRIDDPSGTSEVWTELEIELESAVVRASLMSLIRGAPEIAEVRLVRPRVEITLAEPTESGATEETGAPSGGEAPPEVAAALGLLSIEDGEIVLHQPDGQTIRMTGLNNRASLRIADGRARGDVEGRLELLAMSGGTLPEPIELPALEWELGLDAAADGTNGSVDVRRVELSGLRAAGTAGWTGTAPDLDVDLDAEAELRRLWTELGKGFVDPATLPPGFTLDDFDVADGRIDAAIRFQGAVPAADPDDPTAALQPLSIEGSIDGVRLRLLDRDDLFDLGGSFTVADRELVWTELTSDGAIGTIGSDGRVALSLDRPADIDVTADLDLAAARAVADGWWPRLKEMAATEDGAEPAGPEEWPRVAGRVQAEASMSLPVDGSFDPATAAADVVTWTARSESVDLRLPTFTESFVARRLLVRGDLKNARLDEGTVTGPGLDATATLQASGWPEAIVVRGDLRAARLDLDALQAALVEPETAWLGPNWIDGALGVGVARAQDEPAEIPPPPANLDAEIGLRADGVQSSGYTLSDVQGMATIKEQKLVVSGVDAALGTGRVTGGATVDWTVEQPAWDTDLRADAIPASTLLEPFAGPLAAALNTQFTGAIDLNGPLSATPEQIIAALTGLADLTASEGTIAAEDLLGNTVSKFLGDQAARWKQLSFDDLDANLEVREGKVFFEKLVVRGETNVTAGGWVGLDGTTNVRLDVRLPRGITPDLGSLQHVADLLQDDQQRITFGVNVTGPGTKPKVEIDLAELQKRAADRGRDKLQGEAQDALDDLIDRNRGGIDDAIGDLLDGVGKTPADSSATVEDKVRDGVGGLLDKLKGGGKKKGGGG